MLSTFKRILVAGALMLAVLSGISTIATAQTGMRTFSVVNDSQYQIDHLYVSPIGYRFWGPDRLGRHVLSPNYRFDLSVVPGWYDVMLIDRDGDRCTVNSVDFRNGDSWTITDGILLYCEFSGM